MNLPASTPRREPLAEWMFWLALAWLVLLAGVLQGVRGEQLLHESTYWALAGLLMLWPLFFAEWILRTVRGNPFARQHLWHAIVPPLRLGGRDHQTGRFVWLPRIGWVEVGRQSLRRLEASLGVPMMCVAVLVLPVLAADYLWYEQVTAHPLAEFAVATSTSFIWLAFTVEFIVMVSITDRRVQYCRRNWVDIVIILLPLVSFLRVVRLGQLMRLQQLGRLSRVYRLRGLSMRLLRAVLVLNLLRHVWRVRPERRLAALREKMHDLHSEIEQIRAEIEHLEAQLAAGPSAAELPAAPASSASPALVCRTDGSVVSADEASQPAWQEPPPSMDRAG